MLLLNQQPQPESQMTKKYNKSSLLRTANVENLVWIWTRTLNQLSKYIFRESTNQFVE